jgi:5-methyltetrahydropteroyltriglutamate--homocysteine methyltransferase
MALAHTLEIPRTGADRELKKALEAYWEGDLDQEGLRLVGQQLRAAHWQLQKEAGIDLVPVGDFTWHDQVLTHSLTFGVIPERFADTAPGDHGDTQHSQERTKWFDTHYHYPVPEFTEDQRFKLSWEQLFEEVDEAIALGHKVKPVLIGPLTYLWLGKAKGDTFDKLDLLDRLLPIYGEILGRLAGQGVEWVQIDEPILSLDLPQDWKNAFERAYHSLQYSPLKKLIATHFGGLGANLGLAVSLPVDGLHLDLACAPDQLGLVFDRLPIYKVLSLGVVKGRTIWRNDVDNALALLKEAELRFGTNLWVANYGSLQDGLRSAAA